MLLSAGTSNHSRDFRFERKENFPYWTFSFFHKGEVYIKSRGIEIKVKAFDLKCFKPNTPYSTRIVPGSKYWKGDWLIGDIRPEWVDLINWKEEVPGIYVINVAATNYQEKIKKHFREALNCVFSSEPNAPLYAMHALEKVFILASKLNDKYFDNRDRRIIKAIEVLSTTFTEYMDVEILSDEVGLSPSRLAHLFTEQVGESPMSYRESIRLNHAKQLLIGSGMTIQEIAMEVAYDCPFHFSKRFKFRVGVSPKNFRKNLEDPDYDHG
ncbi:MAG: hypothetical protein COA79_07320 [Planctomycetota bacterium]|nr:MAG: hypothetical protein COA79_07320 [Planctomycetota bacterium]